MGIAAEPGQLALGIVPGGLLHLGCCFGNGDAAIQCGKEFFIADGLHRGAICRDALPKQAADLIEKSHFQHHIHPAVDAIV